MYIVITGRKLFYPFKSEKLIRYMCHTVETGNEFSVNNDEKADNYELNLARHAFSCSMRSVCLLQNSCDMPLVA